MEYKKKTSTIIFLILTLIVLIIAIYFTINSNTNNNPDQFDKHQLPSNSNIASISILYDSNYFINNNNNNIVEPAKDKKEKVGINILKKIKDIFRKIVNWFSPNRILNYIK